MYLHTGQTDTLQNLFTLLIQLQTQYPALEGSKIVESVNNEDLQSYMHILFLKHLALREYEQETPLKNSKLNSNMSCTRIHKLIEKMHSKKNPLLHLSTLLAWKLTTERKTNRPMYHQKQRCILITKPTCAQVQFFI